MSTFAAELGRALLFVGGVIGFIALLLVVQVFYGNPVLIPEKERPERPDELLGRTINVSAIETEDDEFGERQAVVTNFTKDVYVLRFIEPIRIKQKDHFVATLKQIYPNRPVSAIAKKRSIFSGRFHVSVKLFFPDGTEGWGDVDGVEQAVA